MEGNLPLNNNSIRVIISGGGTGGHIFPAIAIANALKKMNEKTDILFVGAQGKMEMEKVPAAGYKIEGLWISGLQRKLSIQNLMFPVKVISSVIKSYRLINKFKPQVAVGVGGYASGPLLYAASRMGIPTIIQEQNSYPGITNKFLAKKADKICVAYSGMEKYFPKNKIIVTGNPVRQDIQNVEGKRIRGMEFFNLSENKRTLLIIGGSLGARTINQSILNGLEKLVENGLQVIWQTGKAFYAQALEATKKFENSGVCAVDFISKMDYAYSVADAVISRAGAISISELCIVQKPCILVPSPNVAEDHQTKNALAMVNHEAAILIKDADAEATLVNEIIALCSDKERSDKLKNNIAKLYTHNSAEAIANEVIALAQKNIKTN